MPQSWGPHKRKVFLLPRHLPECPDIVFDFVPAQPAWLTLSFSYPTVTFSVAPTLDTEEGVYNQEVQISYNNILGSGTSIYLPVTIGACQHNAFYENLPVIGD